MGSSKTIYGRGGGVGASVIIVYLGGKKVSKWEGGIKKNVVLLIASNIISDYHDILYAKYEKID